MPVAAGIVIEFLPSGPARCGACHASAVCRNIRPLHNFAPSAPPKDRETEAAKARARAARRYATQSA